MKKWTTQEEFQLECLAGKYNNKYLATHFKTTERSIENKLEDLGINQKENIQGLGLYSQSEALKYLGISYRFLKKLIQLEYITPKKKNCDNFYQLYTSEEIEKLNNFLKSHHTISKFASLVSLSERTIYNKIDANEISIVKIGSRTFIHDSEKQKFIESDELKTNYIHISAAEKVFCYSKRHIYRKYKEKHKFNNRTYISLQSAI